MQVITFLLRRSKEEDIGLPLEKIEELAAEMASSQEKQEPQTISFLQFLFSSV